MGEVGIRTPMPPVIEPISIEPKVTVTVGHENWSLCVSTERKYYEAQDAGDAFLVITYHGQPALLMKFNGKITALGLTDVSVGDAEFGENKLYSPVNPELRKTLEDAFDRGETSINMPSGIWGFMREAAEYHDAYSQTKKDIYPDAFLTDMRQVADRFMHVDAPLGMIENIQRATWRSIRSESHHQYD